MGRPLKVMSALAVQIALTRSLLPAWRAEGNEVDVQWDPTAVLMERIRNGERADVLIMIDSSMQEMSRQGIVFEDSVTPIARSGLGLGVAAGSRRPDISTPESFVRALFNARSIAYSRTGASGIYFAELIRHLDIADHINERALITPGGFTAKHLLTGECDLAVQQISELMSVEGVEVVGAFPKPYQKPTDLSVAIFSGAEDRGSALRFIAHLTSSQAAEAYERGGLESRLARNSAPLHGMNMSQLANSDEVA